jgi:hypothetical protein
MSYIEHLLSSSISLKKKEYSPSMVGGNLREVGQVLERIMVLFVVSLEHGTCLHLVLQLGNLLVSESYQSYESLYSFDSPKECPSYCHTMLLVNSMLPSHFSCLTMFKGSFSLSPPLCSITNLHPHVSLCSFDPSSYITFLCQFHVDDGGHIMALLR